MKGKSARKKQRGFTLLELMTVMAVLSIFMMMTAPKFRDMADIGESLSNGEKHKMLVAAIHTWTNENKWSYQRPGDFEVKNSQGKTVVDYLKETELQVNTASGKVFLEDESCKVFFEKGVLRTVNFRGNAKERVYTVFEAEDPAAAPADIKLAGWDFLRNIHHEDKETPEEYNKKKNNKNQKKLLLAEDNAL